MQISARESWLLNFYRNSELHGALLMGKLARTYDEPALVLNLTRHCATEAHHAELLSETMVALGVRFDLRTKTIQNYYAAEGGLPKTVIDLLVLSETLEKRVLTSYRDHRARGDVHPAVHAVLSHILREMEEEEDGAHAGWIDKILQQHPPAEVEAAESKWRAVDAKVATALQSWLVENFDLKTAR